MFFKSSFWDSEDARFLTGVWHLDLDFDIVTGLCNNHEPYFVSLFWFWGCKEHPCPLSPHLGLWRKLKVLTGVWYLDLDLDNVIGLSYTLVPNLVSLSWFCRRKKHPCPLSSHLWLWWMLEAPNWGLASWSWLGYGHWSLIHPYSKFWLYILILKVQRTSMSFKSSFGAFEDTGGFDWGLSSWCWF